MAQWNTLGSAAAATLGLFALANHSVAQYVVDNSKLPSGPGINSRSENVDFADIDLDGDWDIAVADGGDVGNDQNRCWVNMGHLQGGTVGQYADQTSTRFPAVVDTSRDIEFVDFDNDGDVDLYISNTSNITNQGNRWWTNNGGKQGGTLGFYSEETALRWIGLGEAGSSIPPSLVVAPGTFVDWSCDCDFADLDNDGDMDLVHSTYGGAFGGQVPTRIFLNDGDGRFREFNPSGFMLPVSTISSGQPGLWCDGNQSTNTTNTSGAFCDIATSTLDIDLGDIDGDFDIDILHGDREQVPRMFANRLDGSSLAPAMGGGALGFRDVSAAVFPSGYSTGNGHYEEEMQDLDRDGDLDIYGLNWQVTGFGFNDITLRNNGSGVFTNTTVLSGSGSDDNEGDFVDYDNDGDMDLYVANFSGQDKLYRNNNTTPGSFSFTQVSVPSFSATSLDADACDTDGDGDYDIVVAEDNNQANTFLRNITGTPDTHAPYLPFIESVTPTTASAGYDAVRVAVHDNAPYYIVWYNDTDLRVTVDGVSIPKIDALSSGGQIFRAELPANLVGSVSYDFTSSDEYNNTGSSDSVNYTGSYAGSYATSYSSGTSGALGGTPVVQAHSVPFAGSSLYLSVSSGAPAGTTAILGLGTAPIPSGISLPGLLFLNISGTVIVIANGSLDAGGSFAIGGALPASTPAGIHFYAQGFVLDSAGGDLFASSSGLDIVTQ